MAARALALALLFVCVPAWAQDGAGTDTVSLKEYVDTRFAATEAQTAIALDAAQDAVLKAEAATERRFENSNEWRNTVETLQRTYMPRTESEAMDKVLQDKLQALTERVNASENRRAGGWEWIVGGLGVIAVLLAIWARFSNPRGSRA